MDKHPKPKSSSVQRLGASLKQITLGERPGVKSIISRLNSNLPTFGFGACTGQPRSRPPSNAPKKSPSAGGSLKARSAKNIQPKATPSIDRPKSRISLSKEKQAEKSFPPALFSTVKQFGSRAGSPEKSSSAVSRFFKVIKLPRRDDEKTATPNLHKFITKVAEPPVPAVKTNPRSVPRAIASPHTRPYFLDDLIRAQTGDMDEYFGQLFRAHFAQILQSFCLLAGLDVRRYRPNGLEAHFSADPPPVSIHNYNINYNFSQNFFGQPLTISSPSSPVVVKSEPVRPRKTLIFDLDETLIHCNENQAGPCDARVPVVFPSGERIEASINIRPYARELLVEMAEHFEVVIFTASHSCYANPVIDHIDPQKVVAKRLFREHCSVLGEGLFTKDLTVLKNRQLKDIILVDNALYSFFMNLGNGVSILPFYHNKKDVELLKLKPFLLNLRDAEDVRDVVGGYFRWELFRKYATQPDRLLQKLTAG